MLDKAYQTTYSSIDPEGFDLLYPEDEPRCEKEPELEPIDPEDDDDLDGFGQEDENMLYDLDDSDFDDLEFENETNENNDDE